MTIYLTLYPPRIYKQVVKLTQTWPMHLNINCPIFSNPGNVKGYLINPFMARALDDHIFSPLSTKNILKVVKSMHPWPEHLHLFI